MKRAKPAKVVPIQGKTLTVQQLFAELASMPPPTAEEQAESERLVAELSGMGGFVSFRVPGDKK